jgi:hypothetical protein
VQECVSELDISFSGTTTDSGVAETVPIDSPAAPVTDPIETSPVSPPFLSRLMSRVRNHAVALATVLLICIPGYFLLDRLFDPPSLKTENEKTVQEIVRILESQPQRQDSALFSERAFGHEMGDESGSRDSIAEQPLSSRPDIDPAAIRKKIEVPATKRIENPEGLNF